jgi:hypothetical protein
MSLTKEAGWNTFVSTNGSVFMKKDIVSINLLGYSLYSVL